MSIESYSLELHVPNVKASMDFYERNLNFRSVATVPESGESFDWGMMINGGMSLMFLKTDQVDALSADPTKEQISEHRRFDIFFKVDDAQAYFEAIHANVRIIHPVHETFYGMNEFSCLDIDNNLILIASDIAQ